MQKGYCITSDESSDFFVGLRFVDGVPEVVFPHGYNLPDDEKELRKDIFRLLAILKRFTQINDGEHATKTEKIITNMPITSYQYIIQDFLSHGYYTEKEVRYIESLRGKINWKRTIQQERAWTDGNNAVYLNFQVKTNRINNDNLISRIHQYCVYLSFFKFGWLYLSSEYLPPKPTFKPDTKVFLSALKKELGNTFNDEKRKLFQSMISILNEEDDLVELNNQSIGVNHFELVWERLVDYIFGEKNKELYFPHATWHIIRNGISKRVSALEPDTIMKHNGNIYVLDSKYYQYGITNRIEDLPQTSSIQKQITYGKHIYQHKQDLYLNDKAEVYNAFIMPYNGHGKAYEFVSVGTADWEKYTADTLNYAYVAGILADTKNLITTYSQKNENELEKLANLIEKSIQEYKQMPC